MKKLSAILALAFLVACNEEAKTVEQPRVTQEAPKEEPKQKIELDDKKTPETRRVCIMVYDAKLKAEVEKCRVMKIHKKFEGTKVPQR